MRVRSAACMAPCLAVVLVAAPLERAAAQDFLFGPPVAQLTVRTGPVVHRANGDLYDFFTSQLTIDKSDFRALSFAGELAVIADERVDIVIGLSYAEMQSGSEFRDWVDNEDLPIEQTTVLSTMPLTASVRLYPLSRGEAISRLAWAPARVTPYIGGGIGLTWYDLRQHGDFIQMSDLSVFPEEYEADGTGRTVHALAGADVWVSARFGINLDARYTYGSAGLGGDFYDWDTLDVSGLQAGVGLTFRW